MTRKTPDEIIEFFLSKFSMGSTEDCWLWNGKIYEGYGRVTGTTALGSRFLRAHRLSYMHFVGPIPSGMVIRHQCDNPRCVNPHHLLVGTIIDNVKDRVERGRNGYPVRPRKLTDGQITNVRILAAEGTKQRDIAKQFAVSQRTIAKIVNNRNGYGRDHDPYP